MLDRAGTSHPPPRLSLRQDTTVFPRLLSYYLSNVFAPSTLSSLSNGIAAPRRTALYVLIVRGLGKFDCDTAARPRARALSDLGGLSGPDKLSL